MSPGPLRKSVPKRSGGSVPSIRNSSNPCSRGRSSKLRFQVAVGGGGGLEERAGWNDRTYGRTSAGWVIHRLDHEPAREVPRRAQMPFEVDLSTSSDLPRRFHMKAGRREGSRAQKQPSGLFSEQKNLPAFPPSCSLSYGFTNFKTKRSLVPRLSPAAEGESFQSRVSVGLRRKLPS